MLRTFDPVDRAVEEAGRSSGCSSVCWLRPIAPAAEESVVADWSMTISIPGVGSAVRAFVTFFLSLLKAFKGDMNREPLCLVSPCDSDLARRARDASEDSPSFVAVESVGGETGKLLLSDDETCAIVVLGAPGARGGLTIVFC